MIFKRLDKNLAIQSLLRWGAEKGEGGGGSIISIETLHGELWQAVFV
jgi:hypothetical protein